LAGFSPVYESMIETTMNWGEIVLSKKFVALITALFLTVLLVSGCGGGSSSTASKNDNSGVVTIKVAAWNDAADSLKAEIEGFQKKYPNIKVEVQYVDNDYTKIMPRLASGSEVPDIIQTQARDFPAFMKKFPGQFVDVTDKASPLKDKFLASSWDSVTVEGKIYAMPWDLGPMALYYRTDMFKEAGIDPVQIETWDDYITAGQKLKEHFGGNVVMTGYAPDFDFFEIFFNQLGGNYATPDGKIALKSEQAIQSLTLWRRMVDSGVAIDIKDWNGRITAVKNNKIASVPYAVWYAGTLMNSVADQRGKWGIIPLPSFTKGGNKQANLGGSVLTIAKKSQNPDAAWKFIEYCLATDEGQTIMLKYGLFPSYIPFYDNIAFKANNDYFGLPMYQFFAKQSDKIIPLHRGPIMLDAVKPLKDMGSAVLSGKNIEESIDTAAQEIGKKTGLPVQ